MPSRFPTRAISLRTVSALVVVVFFAVYTASGLVAGGKLFDMAFSGLLSFTGLSDYHIGVWLTLIIVLAYTSVGGFLAVSMTDFVQIGRASCRGLLVISSGVSAGLDGYMK